MGFEEALNEVLSNLVVRESQWKFVTSAGASLGVSTPWARVGLNAAGGAFWVKRDSDAEATRLDFGGIGGGVGLSLVPTPANFSFSIPEMPSAGRIYKLPFAGWTLTKDEMQGMFIMIEISGDFGAGGSAALMFIGGNTLLSSMAGPMMIPAVIASSEACVAFGGMTATLIPANVGITAYAGIIY